MKHNWPHDSYVPSFKMNSIVLQSDKVIQQSVTEITGFTYQEKQRIQAPISSYNNPFSLTSIVMVMKEYLRVIQQLY